MTLFSIDIKELFATGVVARSKGDNEATVPKDSNGISSDEDTGRWKPDTFMAYTRGNGENSK